LFGFRSESFQTAHSESATVVESRLSRLADIEDNSLVRIDSLESAIVHLRTEVVTLHSVSNDSHQLSAEVGELRTAVSQLKDCVRWFESTIVSQLPPLFTEFNLKRFTLLWRGSRDGFSASEFHLRCCGRANTLTIIEDTKGNIFGGFTPLKWESSGSNKCDDSLKSFLFTLKNPHNIPAKRFQLKADQKNRAIYCGSDRGPTFDGMWIYDNCNSNTRSNTDSFGEVYTNDTGRDGKTFFAGSMNFTVKEIEVFEITD
jgi:hypothetical protein